MVDPLLALIVFAGVLALLAVVLWPRVGVLARVRRWSRAGLRVSMEDALKHLFKAERRNVAASLESLAGALESGQQAAARVLTHLAEAGLVHADRPLVLTEEGRRYALRIIRTHRLWERYLADRTGVEPGEWHAAAEEREHWLSEDDVELLASRLGHPRYDPHGDPIPTASGEIPEPAGVPLPSLTPGQEGVITHLEDEPRELYDRLVALGLSPALPIQVVESGGGRIRAVAGGRSVELDALAAGNVTVEVRPGATEDVDEPETLADLEPGETAEVLGLAPTCQGIQRRRLLDLGVVPGTRVTSEFRSTAGDPVAFLVRGALIALRRSQQRWVRVRRLGGEEAA